VGLIRRAEPPPVPVEARESLRSELVAGLRIVAGHPLLRSVTVGAVALDLSFSLSGTAYLLFVTRELGFQPGVLGMVFAAGGLSSLGGALLAGRLPPWLGTGPTLALALLVAGVGQVFVPLAAGATLAALALLVANQLVTDSATTIFEVHQVSVRQALTPGRALGRVNASIRVVGLGAMLAGTLLSGLLAETLGPRAALYVGAAVMLVAGGWLLASPLRKLDALPREAGA